MKKRGFCGGASPKPSGCTNLTAKEMLAFLAACSGGMLREDAQGISVRSDLSKPFLAHWDSSKDIK